VLGTMLLMQIVGLVKLNLHLGKPMRFYRGFNNLRHSPVSREIAGVSLFFGGLAAYTLFSLLPMFDLLAVELLALLARISAYIAITGLVLGSWYMVKLYRIPARPFWDHWQTASAFLGNTLSLGAVLIALISSLTSGLENNLGLIQTMALVALIGVFVETIGHLFHGRDMQAQGGEGAASYYEQTTTYGYSYQLRNTLLAINLLALAVITMNGLSGMMAIVGGVALTLSIVTASIISRALFYVLVIPTTMPGAFFWRNKGFQEHAQEVGLADMPQVGLVPDGH